MVNLPDNTVPLLLQGHVIDVLKTLPENSVQCVVTSPPYWGGLRRYNTEPQVWGGTPGCEHKWRHGSTSMISERGKIVQESGGGYTGDTCNRCGAWRGEFGHEPTPQLYIQHSVDIFRELRRILRDDGVIWWNVKDVMVGYKGAHYGDTPGNLTAHTPTSNGQRITVATPQESGEHDRTMAHIPERLVLALNDEGWLVRGKIVWMANRMPESMKNRPTRTYEMVYMLTKNARYYYDNLAVRQTLSELTRPEVGVTYRGQGTKDYAGAGVQNPSDTKRRIVESMNEGLGSNLRDVWVINNQNDSEYAHYAVFPPALPERCILLSTGAQGACAKCGAPLRRETRETRETRSKNAYLGDAAPPGGATKHELLSVETTGWSPACSCGTTETVPCIVLDPFSGSGTTCAVARRLGRRSIGVDLNASYISMAEARVRTDVPDLKARW